MDKERKDCLDQLDRIDITERDAAIKLIAKLRTDLTWKASFLRGNVGVGEYALGCLHLG